MIRDQVIEQCLSSRLRRRLLREPELTLEKTIEIGRSFEASERQASQMEADSLKTTDSNLGVNAIRSQNKAPTFPASTTHKQDVRISSVIAVEMQVTELKTPVALPKACLVTTATNVGILLEYAVNRYP